MTDIEEQIAQRIDKALDGDCGHGVGESLAAVVMPLVKRAQAEALREHGRVIAYWERGNSSRVLRYSVDRLVADLNERADQIEKEAGA